MTIPKKQVKEVGVLYVRGVYASNILYLQKLAKKQEYKSLGEFMNDLCKDLRKRK